MMQAAVKIIKSSPIGRLNPGFGNTDYGKVVPLFGVPQPVFPREIPLFKFDMFIEPYLL